MTCDCMNCKYTRLRGGYMVCTGSTHRQTKWESLKEALTNVVIGIGVAVPSQLVYFHFAGIESTASQTFGLAVWMTVISITRSYLVRRYSDNKKFNNKQR